MRLSVVIDRVWSSNLLLEQLAKIRVMSDDELFEITVEQPLTDVAADLSAIADALGEVGEELTIEHGTQSATIPAPSGDVEFEIEVEREDEDDGVEYELEFEIEWIVPADSTGDGGADGEDGGSDDEIADDDDGGINETTDGESGSDDDGGDENDGDTKGDS